MSAYWIARVAVHDGDRYREYVSRTPDIINHYGGRFIARGGRQEVLEGDDRFSRTAVIEFPDLESALACYQSQEYQSARGFRKGAAEAEVWIVDGVMAAGAVAPTDSPLP